MSKTPYTLSPGLISRTFFIFSVVFTLNIVYNVCSRITMTTRKPIKTSKIKEDNTMARTSLVPKDLMELYQAVKYEVAEFYPVHGMDLVELWKVVRGRYLDISESVRNYWIQECLSDYRYDAAFTR